MTISSEIVVFLVFCISAITGCFMFIFSKITAINNFIDQLKKDLKNEILTQTDKSDQQQVRGLEVTGKDIRQVKLTIAKFNESLIKLQYDINAVKVDCINSENLTKEQTKYINAKLNRLESNLQGLTSALTTRHNLPVKEYKPYDESDTLLQGKVNRNETIT